MSEPVDNAVEKNSIRPCVMNCDLSSGHDGLHVIYTYGTTTSCLEWGNGEWFTPNGNSGNYSV